MKKVLTFVILAVLALTGILIIGGIAGIGSAGKLGATLFLSFLALIIACQVAPAFILVGVLLKEIFRPSPSEKEEVRIPAGTGDGN